MTREKMIQYSKKLFVMILILDLFIPSIIANTVSTNNHMNDDISIKNPISIYQKYKSIQIKDDYVFLSTYHRSCEIWDVSNPKAPFLAKTIKYDWILKFSDNYMFDVYYGFIHISTLEDPVNPTFITSYNCTIKDVLEIHIESNFIYLLFENKFNGYSTSSVAIFNFSDLNNIHCTGIYNSTNPVQSFDLDAENDYLLIKDNLAYLLTPSDCNLEIIDISNKSNPYKRSYFSLPSRPNTIKKESNVILILTEGGHLQLVNCNDPDAPTSIQHSYNSSIIYDIEIQNNIVYFIHSMELFILDITDFENIVTIGSYIIKNQGRTSFRHLEIQENFVYTTCQSQYEDRLFFILDCSDLTNPTKLYPRGIKLNSDTLFTLIIIAQFSGFILGPILLVVGLYFLVKKLKQRRLRVHQNEQKN